MTSGKVVLSVLAGVAAGTALGVLFAPDKGTTTRNKITQKREAYLNELSEKVDDFVNSINKKFETVKKEATRMIEKGKSEIEDLEIAGTAATNSKMH